MKESLQNLAEFGRQQTEMLLPWIPTFWCEKVWQTLYLLDREMNMDLRIIAPLQATQVVTVRIRSKSLQVNAFKIIRDKY